MEPRFKFGENWTNYLSHVDDRRIQWAIKDFQRLVGEATDQTFLDIGCGSGIHSLAAVRQGAARVFSFDYDQDSVTATRELKRRYAPDADWHIEQGSVLDEAYMRSLGQFDIVYSWGVLHHTGKLRAAMNYAAIPCRNMLVLGIYHDDGWRSRMWQSTKRIYSQSGRLGRSLILAWTFVATWGAVAAYNTIHGRPFQAVRQWRNRFEDRGMHPWIDLVDWAGGYPFEVARPSDVAELYRQLGFLMTYSRILGGRACNDYVFRKINSTASVPISS